MKKLISLFLVVALIAGFMVTPAYAAGATTVSVESVTAEPGDEVTVAVTIANNPGFKSGKVVLTYDASALSVKTEVDDYGDAEPVIDQVKFAGVVNAKNAGEIVVNHASATAVKGDGILFTVTFIVNENVSCGDSAIKATISGMRDNSGVEIAVTAVAGAITVDHVDADKDHACDNGCDEVIGEHTDADKNHKCDYCGEIMSECADENDDHKCDLCGKELTTCADENKDHKCDLCGKELTTCADENKDHKCDTCGKELTTCADGNKDHKCDICGKELTTCADGNKDHKCDICGKELTTCADENKDHKCDLCGKELTACADGDKDHKCDVCGETVSECADANKDHKCDTCGETVSECGDANGDHNCDVCGEKLSEHADEDGDHLCDICDETLSEHEDADGDGVCDSCGVSLDCVDEDKDHICDDCGEVLSRCRDWNRDHKCDYCGKTVNIHVDINKNHICEYCCEKISDCADANKDHYCDYCCDKLTDCVDEDGDGKCDICGKELPVDPEVIRVGGAVRSETARMIADELKAVLGIEKFDAIVYASGDAYPDALTGTYLANLENAPILLYRQAQVAKNLAYIQENLAKDGVVYILGGTGAVPASVEAELTAAGIKVVRLGGISRYETNLEILDATGFDGGKTVLVCTGNEYADALAASATGMPILLVNNKIGKLNDLQVEYLKGLAAKCEFILIGGEGAISAELAAELAGYDVDGKVERIGGATRYETCVMVADEFFADAKKVVVAFGREYPDALCGGTLGYALKAPVILVQDSRAEFVAEYLAEEGIASGYVLGGTGRVTDKVACVIFDLNSADEIIVR